MLKDVAWEPKAPDHWTSPDGRDWELGDEPGGQRIFYAAFIKSIQEQKWTQAAKHHLGQGLVRIPDLTVPRKFLKRLRNQGKYAEAGMALTIMSGGLWTNVRSYDEGYVCSRLCPACGLELDTEMHRGWGGCTGHGIPQLPEVLASSYLVKFAMEASDDDHTLWLRGLPPLQVDAVPPPPQVLTCHAFGDLPWDGDKVDVSQHHVYLDESGGENASDNRFTRAGWGLALIDAVEGQDGMPKTTNFRGGWAGDLPGEFQTAPRACLQAFIFALANTKGHLVVKPDASYLVDGFRERRFKTPDGTNADLWHEVGQLINTRPRGVAGVEVVKVDAHIKAEVVIAGGVDMDDYHGNVMADALAGHGASISAVPQAVVQAQAGLDTRSWKILHRLVAVNMQMAKSCPKRSGEHKPKRQKQAKTHLQRLFDDSGHDFNGLQCPRRIRHLPTRLACGCCGQGSSKKTIKAWLKQSPCKGPMIPSTTIGCDAVRPQPDSIIRVGRADLHRSHLLRHRLGLWWCSSCGYYTTVGNAGKKSSAKNLKKECSREASGAGKDYLDRIALGKMPKKGLEWPQPMHTTQWAYDPFDATPRFRLHQKSTLSLGQLEAQDLPDPVDDLDLEGPVQEEPFEEEDPFALGQPGLDQGF